jgi:hypothetical protein
MAEKRLLNRMSERLRRFEVDETLAIRKALASEEEYSQELQVLMKSRLGGDLARRPGGGYPLLCPLEEVADLGQSEMAL